MSSLQRLREAQTIKDVAGVLGFKPSTLAYILYKMPDGQKYTSFTIPKRSGGARQIKAPASPLRLLQRRLANVLYLRLDEVEKGGTGRRSLAHGFARGRSIVTNASIHKRRRYVLNLDLEDFFPSFNFGRVRGFFIKDKNFALQDKVATIIAQIACHDNELPQGSPCSPIVSNLIAHLLDVQLARLAKTNKCTYSRYADDITFSTNRKDFPSDLAAPAQEISSQWRLGTSLIAEIGNAGFRINTQKVRMQLRGSRQTTTGLLVNEKVNIRPEYYRAVRAMCHALFSTGAYYRLALASRVGGVPTGGSVRLSISGLEQIEGMLAHIHYVKHPPAKQRDADKKKPPSAQALYSRFLFYKNFVALQAPLIVPEGKTNSIYLRAAIKQLEVFQPQLGQVVNGMFSTTVRFMNCTRTVYDILQMGNGSGAFAKLIYSYKRTVEGLGHAPLVYPVILLVDNDDGADSVFKAMKGAGGLSISHASKDLFYHISANLYVIKTPESIGLNPKSRIEDLFDQTLLTTVIDGKTFDPDKEHGADGKYGKLVFAENVIRPNADTIDFSRFEKLLERVAAALKDYEKQKLASAIAVA